ncbi:MAG: MOSC domain-containing protein [marine benthic group bacterium]|nr:MOSC domain-containing protein [Candidatus Benthicola marisminoris]
MNVTGLFVYPLKSARGLTLAEASLDSFGIEGDRRWCLLGTDGKVITQRDCQALATLRARPTGQGLELEAPGMGALSVRRPAEDRDLLPIGVWKDRTRGAPADPAADAWLEDFLGRPCRLLYMPREVHRQVSLDFGREGDRVSYADGYPLLLTSGASLTELNRRLDTAVPMDRFRANLVVDGDRPFEEDDWARIRVGEMEFRVVKPCARCVVTTVDQQTGERGPEPLRALASFRSDGGKVLFGQNLIHSGPGRLRIGDPVEVLERRTPSG